MELLKKKDKVFFPNFYEELFLNLLQDCQSCMELSLNDFGNRIRKKKCNCIYKP